MYHNDDDDDDILRRFISIKIERIQSSGARSSQREVTSLPRERYPSQVIFTSFQPQISGESGRVSGCRVAQRRARGIKPSGIWLKNECGENGTLCLFFLFPQWCVCVFCAGFIFVGLVFLSRVQGRWVQIYKQSSKQDPEKASSEWGSEWVSEQRGSA